MQQNLRTTGADTSNFAKKDDLANLKSLADKFDVHTLAPVPTDLSKLSDRKWSCQKRYV